MSRRALETEIRWRSTATPLEVTTEAGRDCVEGMTVNAETGREGAGVTGRGLSRDDVEELVDVVGVSAFAVRLGDVVRAGGRGYVGDIGDKSTLELSLLTPSTESVSSSIDVNLEIVESCLVSLETRFVAGTVAESTVAVGVRRVVIPLPSAIYILKSPSEI